MLISLAELAMLKNVSRAAVTKKIKSGNAVIATNYNKFAGFCYIEVWGEGKYVAHSGLIVAPEFRGLGLAKKIKQ